MKAILPEEKKRVGGTLGIALFVLMLLVFVFICLSADDNGEAAALASNGSNRENQDRRTPGNQGSLAS